MGQSPLSKNNWILSLMSIRMSLSVAHLKKLKTSFSVQTSFGETTVNATDPLINGQEQEI